LTSASVGLVYSRAVGEEQAPTDAPGTEPGGNPSDAKIGEALASELSRVVAAYTQQIQEALQTCLSQLTEQWQSAFAVYAAEYTKQWQEAMRAVAVQKTHGAPTSESFEEKREEAD
jgi:hypothetical protein